MREGGGGGEKKVDSLRRDVRIKFKKHALTLWGCVLPIDERKDRYQQVNRGIPLQRLDLLSQGNLEEKKLTNDLLRETESSH